MMLIISDKYHVEMHLGNHVGEHTSLVRRTVMCKRGNMFLLASTIRHRDLSVYPGVEKQVVLFGFPTPGKRHRRVDVEGFMLNLLPRTKAERARNLARNLPARTNRHNLVKSHTMVSR